MPTLDKKDLQQIKEILDKSIDERVPKIIDERVPKIVLEVVEPFFRVIQENFNHIQERFDKIENLILADHRKRIERLEAEVRELKELLSIK